MGEAVKLAEALYWCRREAFSAALVDQPWSSLPADVRRHYLDLATILLPVLHPTAEPPDWEDLADRRSAWAATWSTIPTKDDVERVRAAGADALSQTRSELLDVRIRLPIVEERTKDLKDDTTIIRAQLTEIARTIGALQVGAPVKLEPAQPAPVPVGVDP